MKFTDRAEAGKKLVPLLKKYHKALDAVVIGLPRGGVVPAYEVAHALALPLDVVSPRKLGAPDNPELALGAITESGEGYFNRHLIHALAVSDEYLRSTIESELLKARQRLELYRRCHPKIPLKGKIAIVVDDGLATGATMKAAVQALRVEGATKIVVAVPVAPQDTLDELAGLADEAVCLYTPEFFQAVGQFYQEFRQVENEEVIALLKKTSLTFPNEV